MLVTVRVPGKKSRSSARPIYRCAMLQPIITFLMIIATGTLQLGSQTVLDRVVDSMHMSHEHADLHCKWAYSTIAILVLMSGTCFRLRFGGYGTTLGVTSDRSATASISPWRVSPR